MPRPRTIRALALALSLAVLPRPGRAATRPSVEKVLAEIQGFYDRTQAFQADFVQVSIRGRTGRKKTRKGRVRVLRPNRIRWDYEGPEPVHYVSDGTVLWVYQPEDALAYRMTLAHGRLDEAIRFLAGGVKLREHFRARVIDPPPGLQGQDLVFVELVPREDATTIRKLVLGVDQPVTGVKISIVVDPDGNEIRTTYEHFRFEAPKPSVFRFTPPPGVRVEDLSRTHPAAPDRTGRPE